jgi:flagellar basal body-associated protein FliL
MPFGNEEIEITIILGSALIVFFAVIIIFLFVLFNNKNKLNHKEKEVIKKTYEQTLLPIPT